eukprot:1159703-Pelagomonas_calceolata.AAC.6
MHVQAGIYPEATIEDLQCRATDSVLAMHCRAVNPVIIKHFKNTDPMLIMHFHAQVSTPAGSVKTHEPVTPHPPTDAVVLGQGRAFGAAQLRTPPARWCGAEGGPGGTVQLQAPPARRRVRIFCGGVHGPKNMLPFAHPSGHKVMMEASAFASSLFHSQVAVDAAEQRGPALFVRIRAPAIQVRGGPFLAYHGPRMERGSEGVEA